MKFNKLFLLLSTILSVATVRADTLVAESNAELYNGHSYKLYKTIDGKLFSIFFKGAVAKNLFDALPVEAFPTHIDSPIKQKVTAQMRCNIDTERADDDEKKFWCESLFHSSGQYKHLLND